MRRQHGAKGGYMDEKRRKQARFADVAARSQRVERARALID